MSDWIAIGGVAVTLCSTIIGGTLILSYKIGGVNKRLGSIEKRLDSVEKRLDSLETRIDRLEIAFTEMNIKLGILSNVHSQAKGFDNRS